MHENGCFTCDGWLFLLSVFYAFLGMVIFKSLVCAVRRMLNITHLRIFPFFSPGTFVLHNQVYCNTSTTFFVSSSIKSAHPWFYEDLAQWEIVFFIAGRHLHLLLTMQLLWKSHILFYLDNNTALSFFCCLPPRPPFSLIHAFMSVAISLFNFIHVSTDVHDSWYSFVIWSSIIQYAFKKKKKNFIMLEWYEMWCIPENPVLKVDGWKGYLEQREREREREREKLKVCVWEFFMINCRWQSKIPSIVTCWVGLITFDSSQLFKHLFLPNFPMVISNRCCDHLSWPEINQWELARQNSVSCCLFFLAAKYFVPLFPPVIYHNWKIVLSPRYIFKLLITNKSRALFINLEGVRAHTLRYKWLIIVIG